ncbi:mechanosensitive ion channel family protein [Haloarcula salinisoli]|uniref:Mechanosensitive ion channel n=1 Tax=Haloarcula salinisoli TaxID=2487746 RepID=A0A8J8C6S8_9EURY|nr:mechanosensitive ion channel domain-containing protein [Halomicroarcula salinisoli]MBX0285900.1 mechanosensitive ion channel [Halomicroarcula salinisoli]MBX0302606.1 mechanosensitive ion channel [Halomicroarcula salinisoli]
MTSTLLQLQTPALDNPGQFIVSVIMDLIGDIGEFVITLLVFGITFGVIYIVGKRFLTEATRKTLNQRDLSPAIVSLGSSIAGTIALFVAVAVAAVVAGYPVILGAFATIAGALALGFAFAASDIIENFVAGIFILKDKPFEIGDYIEWNGNGGIVREIDLRVSKLDTWDNEQLTVPNGELANAVVKNTQAHETRRVTVDIGVDYGSDVDKAREILLEEAAAIDGVLEDPEPAAPLTTLGDSAIVFNARMWINPQETGAGGVKHKFTETVMDRFDEADIGFPYPHTEVVGSLDVNQTESSAVADD